MVATTATPSNANLFPPPPPGLNYIAALQPSITFLMIGTTFSGILLPLLVALFQFSTKSTRRKPIFILNVISITLGLILGIYNAYIEVSNSTNKLPLCFANFRIKSDHCNVISYQAILAISWTGVLAHDNFYCLGCGDDTAFTPFGSIPIFAYTKTALVRHLHSVGRTETWEDCQHFNI